MRQLTRMAIASLSVSFFVASWKKITFVVREVNDSRHNGGSPQTIPIPCSTVMIEGFQGAPQLELTESRDTTVSQTAVRLIAVVFPVRKIVKYDQIILLYYILFFFCETD